MIKTIEFLKTNAIGQEPIKIDLDPKINVIIGPKGGGKSTLFDLLAGIKNNYISDNVVKALAEYNLKFHKAIQFNNEEINANQLSRKKEKEKLDDYQNRYDVIYQDDPIKKSLTSMSEIENQKFQYLKNTIINSDSVTKFIFEIKELYNSMKRINEWNKSDVVNINWTNTFKMNELTNNDHLAIITKLNYNSINLEQKIKNEISNLETNILKYSKAHYGNLTRMQNVDFYPEFKNEYFENKVNDLVAQSISINNELIQLVEKRIKEIVKIQRMISSFDSSYKKIINKIKQNNFQGSGLKSYETQAKEYFKNMAHEIYSLKQNFEKLFIENNYLEFDNDIQEPGRLAFFLENKILLNDEQIKEILLSVFYSPGTSISDVTKWLKTMISKGIQPFDESKIINAISRALKEEVQVLADGRPYDSLSLGQRSIYGLKYKFYKSINDDIFLDQPEDNLDNNTIAKQILEMVSQKRDNQIIIVTHNANIGILTNPQKIIVANLLDEKNPYKEGVMSNTKEKESDSAFYLEGGDDYLNQRFNKIIKGEK